MKPMGKHMKETLVVAAIVAAALFAYYLFVFLQKDLSPVEEPLSEKIGAAAELNIAGNLPETNPFEANTNPFQEAGYQNPFRQ